MSGPVTCGVCSEPLTWVSGEYDEAESRLYKVTVHCERCGRDWHRAYETASSREPSVGSYVYERTEGGFSVACSIEAGDG